MLYGESFNEKSTIISVCSAKSWRAWSVEYLLGINLGVFAQDKNEIQVFYV